MALLSHLCFCTSSTRCNCREEINWNNVETVKVERDRFNRKVCEALEIQLNECGPAKGGINQDDGQYVDRKFWMPYFKYLHEKGKSPVQRLIIRKESNAMQEDTLPVLNVNNTSKHNNIT